MNAHDVARLWCFGKVLDEDAPMTCGGVAEAVASLLTGEEGVQMRARARDLQVRVVRVFESDRARRIRPCSAHRVIPKRI
jgi:hypothetical protein